MNTERHAISARLVTFILLSWVLVGGLSGRMVYQSILRQSANNTSGWIPEMDAVLMPDPSALTVQEDLSLLQSGHSPHHKTRSNDGSGALPDTEAMVDDKPSGTERASAREADREQAAAIEEARQQARRAIFDAVMDGKEPVTSLTPDVIAALGVEDIAAALAKVQSLPWGEEANSALQGLLARWGKLEPQNAADYALGLDSNRAGSEAIKKIWSRWADENPDAAMDWYFNNLDENAAMLSPSLRAVFSRLEVLDPAEALVMAWQLPQAMSKEALRAIVSQSSKDGNLDALRSVVLTIAPGEQRNMMVSAIVQEYAVYQPAEALQWVNMLEDVPSRNTAVNQLVSVWGYDQPDDAANWIASLPDEDMQGRSAATLIRTWSGTEPEAAGEWLNSMPPSSSMDAALQTYVRNTMHDTPEQAIVYVERITDPKLRNRLAISVGKAWMKENPVQAKTYFETSDWDASVRNNFQ